MTHGQVTLVIWLAFIIAILVLVTIDSIAANRAKEWEKDREHELEVAHELSKS